MDIVEWNPKLLIGLHVRLKMKPIGSKYRL